MRHPNSARNFIRMGISVILILLAALSLIVASFVFLRPFNYSGVPTNTHILEAAPPILPPPDHLSYVPLSQEEEPADDCVPESEHLYIPEYENAEEYEYIPYEPWLYEYLTYVFLAYTPSEEPPAPPPPLEPEELPPGSSPGPSPGPLTFSEHIYPNSPFNAFSFYIPENAELYEYYFYRYPHLTKETVVWMINAHQHLPFHSCIRINCDPNPLLVNPFYRLPPGFRPNVLVPVNNANCNLRATPEAVAAFHLLRESAREHGFNLSVTSAFRTAEHQHRLWANRNFTDGVVARPYHSEHQTGRALDLAGPNGLLDSRGPTPTGIWVAENAHRYGFIIRYRADTTHITSFIHEPWHLTYVGVDISMHMYENNILSLEEFVGRNPGVTFAW